MTTHPILYVLIAIAGVLLLLMLLSDVIVFIRKHHKRPDGMPATLYYLQTSARESPVGFIPGMNRATMGNKDSENDVKPL